MNYGYNCPLCGDPIKEPQATEHTDDGLAHLTCVNRLIMSKNINGPKATAAALAAQWQAAERELRALTGAESHPIIRCELRTRAEQLAQCRRDLLRAFGIEEK